MEFDYVMSFLDPKYPNSIRILYESDNFGYFIDILIIYLNRSGPEKNRSESEPKIYKYLLGSNV